MQVLEILDQEVLEAPQCAGLVESDCLQQGQKVSSDSGNSYPQGHSDQMNSLFLHKCLLHARQATQGELTHQIRSCCSVYELRYFNIADNEGEEEE